jgi:glutaminyl-peptide cyclotransferase
MWTLSSERMTRRAVLMTLPLVALVAAGCSRPEFDQAAAFARLEEQCEFGPRPPGSDAHEQTMVWLVETLSQLTDRVSVQRFSVVADSGDVELTNVIASFNPGARERVLLGAHWDTRAIAENDPDPANRCRPIPGANDGASGVAVLLELARLVSESPPHVGVDMVFFDGEDGGNGGGLPDWCLGSTYYARSLRGRIPAYAVVIDMIGDAELEVPREPNSVETSGEVVDRVWDAARRAGSNRFVDGAGKPTYDDHIPLIRVGVPTALVIDFDYAYWHTLADTPDKCSPESLGEVGRALVALLY